MPRLVKAAGCRVWSPFFREVTSLDLYEAKELGLARVVWTVNEATHIEVMLELGVDGIISDRPDIVRTLMESGGLRLPSPSLGAAHIETCGAGGKLMSPYSASAVERMSSPSVITPIDVIGPGGSPKPP